MMREASILFSIKLILELYNQSHPEFSPPEEAARKFIPLQNTRTIIQYVARIEGKGEILPEMLPEYEINTVLRLVKFIRSAK